MYYVPYAYFYYIYDDCIWVSKHGIEIFAEENSLQKPLFALERKYLIRRIILTFPYAFIVDIYEGYVYVHLR